MDKFDLKKYLAEGKLLKEASASGLEIYELATPQPKSILKEELEDLFGSDYRNIITEFSSPEGYESVLMVNITDGDIEKIKENIGDVLIWKIEIGNKESIAEGKLLKEEKIDRKTFNAAAIEAIQQLSTDVIKTKSQFNKLKRELHRIYDDGDINTREDIDDNIEFILGNHIVRQKVLGENKSLKEGLKVNKGIWDGMSDDEKESTLLTVFEDPDDVEKYIDSKWEDLPNVATSNMIKENSVDLDSDIKDGIKNFIYGEEFLIRLLNLVPEEYGDITFDDPLMQDLKPHLDELIEMIANEGVEIQNHISKTYLGENKLVKENKGEDIDDLFNAIQSRLKNQNKINENGVDVIAITGILSVIFGLMVAGFIDTTDEGDQIKEWFKTKVLPKIKKIIGSDRKIKSILSKLKNNPEAMEAITNAKRGDFKRTVRKFLTDDEYFYLDRITRDQIKSGEATDYQLRSINLLGKKKEEYK